MMTVLHDEEYEKCCFGITDVRKATRFIAKMNVGLIVLAIVITIIGIIIEISLLLHTFDRKKEEIEKYEIFILLTYLLVESVFLYFNVRLQKSTYESNVQNIRHWLILYLTYLIYISIAFGLMTIIYGHLSFLVIGILMGFLIGYMRSVVKRFYHAELEGRTITDTTAILPQSTLNGHQN